VVAPDKDHKPKYTERLNGPIQSTAGDILYLTLQKLASDPRPDTHFLLSVHDDLVLAAALACWKATYQRKGTTRLKVIY
jgi:DNA polymerase I-like protein with 3'-5' exonuclease and polymerase domains